MKEKEEKNSYPDFICPMCSRKTNLDFDPRSIKPDKKSRKSRPALKIQDTYWEEFQCLCGYRPYRPDVVKQEELQAAKDAILSKTLFG